MRTQISYRQYVYGSAVALALLLLIGKFFWSYFTYRVPMGYDVGLYRYLFIKHGEAFPPFILGDVQDWARDHSLGLFMLAAPFLKLGLPVDWLIGWIWNLVPIALIVTLAWAMATSTIFQGKKGFSKGLFLATLVAGVLSLPLYDGFVSMYWKTYAALFFVVLTFALIERKSWWALLPAFLVLIVHNQTGALFAVSMILWWGIAHRNSFHEGAWITPVALGMGIGIAALLFYLPILQEALLQHLATAIGENVNATRGGGFPDLSYYLPRYGIQVALGLVGISFSFKQKQFSMWHTAFIVSALFVVMRVFFYRRFIIHADFFLLPFVAYALVTFWMKWNQQLLRGILLLIVALQGWYMWELMHERWPVIKKETYDAIQMLPEYLPSDAIVSSFENSTPLWIRGWLPNHRVIAPGFFEPTADKEGWEDFLTLGFEYRRLVLGGMPGNMYAFMPTEYVLAHGGIPQNLLDDPCLTPVPDVSFLWKIICFAEE